MKTVRVKSQGAEGIYELRKVTDDSYQSNFGIGDNVLSISLTFDSQDVEHKLTVSTHSSGFSEEFHSSERFGVYASSESFDSWEVLGTPYKAKPKKRKCKCIEKPTLNRGLGKL